METFTCRACSRGSSVKHTKADAGNTYLVCEHCGAEHVLKKVFGASGVPPQIKAGPLRGSPPDSGDAA